MLTIPRLMVVFCVILSGAVLASPRDATTAIESVQTIVVPMAPPAEGVREYHYFSPLLKLALDKTVLTDGAFRLEESKTFLIDNRLKAALRLGHVDVIWSGTSPELEQTLLPVRISLLKEFGDYRIFIIRAGEQARFDHIHSLDDLRKLTGGMGSQWADMDIMRANDLSVVSAVGYERLFKMLAAKRFDYFSRGLYQVKREVEARPELAMEENLMLHYPSPFYFFGNRNNLALAERIERGLQIALADGSFDELFFSLPRHQWARDELLKKQRRILSLQLPAPMPESLTD